MQETVIIRNGISADSRLKHNERVFWYRAQQQQAVIIAAWIYYTALKKII